MSTGETAPPGDSPDLLADVERLIGELQNRHGVEVRDLVTRLLADIDAVHRAGLTHLMDAIRGMAGDAFINRLIADPAIRLLLMSYDLVPIDRRLMAEEAMDAVRGHLHARGIDLEILDVVGGVVYMRIHGLTAGGIDQADVVRDVEEALRDGFIGFQELVPRERASTATATTIAIGGLRKAHRPVYHDALAAGALASGQIKGLDVNGQPILIARVGDDYFAVSNRCGESPLPLEFSTLEGTELVCSWHGCRYDVRTGVRLDRGGERLPVYPVRIENGRLLLAVEVEAVQSPNT